MRNRIDYYRAYRAKRRQRPDLPHGTDNGYVNWGCRCDRCRGAHSHARLVDRALAAHIDGSSPAIGVDPSEKSRGDSDA